MGSEGTEDTNAEQDALDSILTSAESKGREIAELGRDLTKAGEELADAASATRRITNIVATPPNIEFLADDWKRADLSATLILQQAESMNTNAFISSSGTAVYSSSDAAFEPNLFELAPAEERPRLLEAVTDLYNVVERSANVDEVVKLMRRLGLDEEKPGSESPLSLFLAAHEAYQVPSTNNIPAATTLIPIRESFRLIIDYLLRQRPKQEKTRKEWDKLISIGSQLAHDGINENEIKSWAFKWNSLLKWALSPAKEEKIDRRECRTRLIKTTLIIKSFLSGIDPAKFRKAA